MKSGGFIIALCFLMLAAASMAAIEDFSTDPTPRGWVDASPSTFYWYASGGSIIGQHGGVNAVWRHLEEAFYLPLGVTLTQNDNFSASWDSAHYGGISGYTDQQMEIGFFNKDNWFLNGTPDSYNSNNEVSMVYWDDTAPSWSNTNVWGRVTTTGTLAGYRDSAMYNVGGNNIMYRYTLTYTAGAGANSAGQLVVTGSTGGTLMFTNTVDLQVGDTFAVNAFGVFTGHTPYNAANGWTAAYPFDNVELTQDTVPSQCGLDNVTFLCGDLNHDCYINIVDLSLVAAQWLLCNAMGDPGCQTPADCGMGNTNFLDSDLNYDCYVDMVDFSLFADQWLFCNNSSDLNCDEFGGALYLSHDTLSLVLNSNGKFKRPVNGVGGGGGGLSVYDGKRELTLELETLDANQGDGQWTLERQSADGAIGVTEQVGLRDKYISWQVSLTNLQGQQQWLELVLSLPTNFIPADSNYWDGYVENTIDYWTGRSTLGLTFPAACVYGRQSSNGVALGINPAQDFSYITSSVHGNDADGKVSLQYSVRVVLEPLAQQTVEFVLFSFPVNYGSLEVVQRYYNSFPEAFTAKAGINPKIIDNGRLFYGTNARRYLQLESNRRMHMGWDWAYGAFQTPGDWYPDTEYWDDNKGYPGNADNHGNPVLGTIEDYRQSTRQRFWEGRETGALLFYALPLNCAKYLIEQHFPDSYFYGASGQPDLSQTGAIKPGDINIQAWYAGGTSYGQEVWSDFAMIASDFKPSGFAFDNSFGWEQYYGPAQEGMRGRSWDAYGTYVASGIAQAELCEWIHQQQVEGYTLGVGVNHPQTYTITRNADAIIFEPSAFRDPYYKARRLATRLLSGHKIISMLMGYNESEEIIRWEELEPGQVLDALNGVIDYQLLWSLRWGAFPSYEALGSKKTHQWAPWLLDILRQGWQPVPAVSADSRLWASRYGSGMNSFIAVSNPTRQTLQSGITVDGRYFGTGSYLLSTYEGQAVECNVLEQQISITATVLSHDANIYQTVLEITGAPLAINGSAAFGVANPGDSNGEMLTANFTIDTASNRTLRCKVPNGAKVQEVILNGLNVGTWLQTGYLLEFSADLSAQNYLEVHYLPSVVIRSSITSIREFPFVVHKVPVCVILTEPAYQVSAKRISAYFEYWYLAKNESPGVYPMSFTGIGPIISIYDPNSVVPDANNYVVVGNVENQPVLNGLVQSSPPHAGGGVIEYLESQGKKALIINGSDSQAIEQATLKLLDILDERYPYYGSFPDTEMYMKAGVAVEDFSSNPATHGWVDHKSADNMIRWYSSSSQQFVYGENIHRDHNDAFYVPTDRVYTEIDNFSAQFDYYFENTAASATSQIAQIGFFDTGVWLGSTPQFGSAVCLRVYSKSTNATMINQYLTLFGNVSPYIFETSMGVLAANIWRTVLLDYTAGAGVNNAGQIRMAIYAQGDLGGTPIMNGIYNLPVGKTFSVNAFGLFTGGGYGFNPTNGHNVAVDNVELMKVTNYLLE